MSLLSFDYILEKCKNYLQFSVQISKEKVLELKINQKVTLIINKTGSG